MHQEYLVNNQWLRGEELPSCDLLKNGFELLEKAKALGNDQLTKEVVHQLSCQISLLPFRTIISKVEAERLNINFEGISGT